MKSLLKFPLAVFYLSLPGQVLVAQESNYTTSAQGPSPVVVIVELLIALFVIVAMWKVFTKAGRPGWAAIIPIYNMYVWCKIVGRPGWWVILMLIPIGEYHRRNYSLHRHGKKFWQRRRVRNRSCSPGNHFSADPRFRQRPISRPSSCARSGGFLTPTSGLGKFLGRVARAERSYTIHFGLRFSLKAAMPSRASSDSRACR